MLKDKQGRTLSSDEVLKKVILRIKAIWEEILLFKVHSLQAIPSYTWRRLLYRLIGIQLGKGSVIHRQATFYALGGIKIGEDTIIGEKATLDGRGTIQIGNHVDIASEVMIYTSEHDINAVSFRAVNAPVVIEDYAFIGPRAIILPGVTIGKGAVVAAGAVVTKNIPSMTVVAGVPAKTIATRQVKELTYRLGRPRLLR